MARETGACRDLRAVLARLQWMRERRIWPNGLRYLWTDAFGVVLLVSLFRRLGEKRYLDRPSGWLRRSTAFSAGGSGICISEAPDRDGGTSTTSPCGCSPSVAWAPSGRVITNARWSWHRATPIRGPGSRCHLEDARGLSGPYPGYGRERSARSTAMSSTGARRRRPRPRDAEMHGSSSEITRFASHPGSGPGHDALALALSREQAVAHRPGPATLESMWVDPPSYFCREPGRPDIKFAFTNYGVSIGLQSIEVRPDRVAA